MSKKFISAFTAATLISGIALMGINLVSAQTTSNGMTNSNSSYGVNRTDMSGTSGTSNTSSGLTNSTGSTNSSTRSGLTNSTGSSSSTGTMNSSSSTSSGATGSTSSSGTMNSTTGTGSSVTPGVPNTGFGGNAAMNWIALFGTGLVAAAGITYLARYATSQ